jgi:hypothetical protein
MVQSDVSEARAITLSVRSDRKRSFFHLRQGLQNKTHTARGVYRPSSQTQKRRYLVFILSTERKRRHFRHSALITIRTRRTKCTLSDFVAAQCQRMCQPINALCHQCQ